MAKTENEKQGHPFEGDLYHGERYTVALRVFSSNSDEEAEWHDLDIRSDVGDKKEAVVAYLKETFGEEIAIDEVDGSTLRVEDPLFGAGECIREYKL